MTRASDWLRARQGVPPALLDRMVAALPERAGQPVFAQLADAGLRALGGVVASAGGRAVAIDLLAADALLTHAYEAAAEEGGEALDALNARLAPDVMARLVSRAAE